MMYYFKKTERTIISSTAPIKKSGYKEVTIAGKVVRVREQLSQDVKFGCTAVHPDDIKGLELSVGDELPGLNLSDKKVVMKDGSEAENLYWTN